MNADSRSIDLEITFVDDKDVTVLACKWFISVKNIRTLLVVLFVINDAWQTEGDA